MAFDLLWVLCFLRHSHLIDIDRIGGGNADHIYGDIVHPTCVLVHFESMSGHPVYRKRPSCTILLRNLEAPFKIGST